MQAGGELRGGGPQGRGRRQGGGQELRPLAGDGVQRAVADLPPQMGRAFRLHKLEGRSQAETAQAMGVSVKAVEKHIASAMKALASRLRP